MAFMKFIPYGENKYSVVSTSDLSYIQILQELVSLRFQSNPLGANEKEASAHWIDQGKQFFLDARNCNWRSSGLLYYYCFLNLSKAYLVKLGHFACSSIKIKSLGYF